MDVKIRCHGMSPEKNDIVYSSKSDFTGRWAGVGT